MMKDEHINKHLERVFVNGERYFGPLRSHSGARRATVYQEMRLGAAIGLLACLIYAGVAGASGMVFLFAAVVGFCAGAVFGLVIWSSSPELPTDPVLPPARGQERYPWHAGLPALFGAGLPQAVRPAAARTNRVSTRRSR